MRRIFLIILLILACAVWSVENLKVQVWEVQRYPLIKKLTPGESVKMPGADRVLMEWHLYYLDRYGDEVINIRYWSEEIKD